MLTRINNKTLKN